MAISELKIVSKTRQVRDYLEETIKNGKVKSGDCIMPEDKLAKQLGVSVITIRRAIYELVDEKLIYRIQGKGTFVSDKISKKKRVLVKTIGFIIPIITVSFFPELAKGTEDVCYREGYSKILCNSEDDPVKEEDYVKKLLNKGIDGIILAPVMKSNIKNWYHLLKEHNVPLVFVDNSIEDIKADFIAVDSLKGSFEITEYLIKQGYRHIGYIAGPVEKIYAAKHRFEGYKKALLKYQIEFNQDFVKYTDYSRRMGYLAMEELIKIPNPPDAIVTSNTLTTLGALDAIRYCELSPEKIVLASFDVIENPPPDILMAMLHQPSYEMGRKAQELLMERIRGFNGKSRKIVMNPELIKIEDYLERAIGLDAEEIRI